jgi:hypothetical protein
MNDYEVQISCKHLRNLQDHNRMKNERQLAVLTMKSISVKPLNNQTN